MLIAMKTGIFVTAMAVLLLISISGAALALDTGASSLRVTLAKYEPYPAEAGQYVDAWFKVENTGSGTASDVVVEMLSRFPFSVDDADATKSIGSITSGGSQLVSYRVKIDEKAASGDNIIQVRHRPNSISPWVTVESNIFIQIHDAVLSISGISSEDLVPGKVQALSMSLENLADTYLKDVSVALDFSSATLPFATVDSVNEKRMASLPSNGKANISFNIITFPDASSGVYKVPLILKYSDATGKSYERNYSLGFVVNAKPDYLLSVQKTDPITEGSSGTVTLSISNVGQSAIKFMTMELLPSDAYDVIGEYNIYLGNLNPDDYQTGAFKIYVKKGSVGQGKTIPLKILLNYRDGLNNDYSKEKILDMRVYTPSEISAYGLAGAGSSNTLLYLIIAAIAIYYIYRKYFKKKAKA